MYCDVDEVYLASQLDNTVVSEPAVTQFIKASQRDVDRDTQTTYWSDLDSGTATSATTTTLTDSAQTMTPDAFIGYYIWIRSGTGAGQVREITDNTDTVITVDRAWTTTPDTTSQYIVFETGTPPFVGSDEAMDGNGKRFMFVEKYPIRSIDSLAINGTTVTPSSVLVWKNIGKIQLGSTSEVGIFDGTQPQLVDLKYWFGVYPLPEEVKRYCIILAAMKTLAAQIGGTFDDPSTYQMPEGSVTVGQAYINIKAAWDVLNKEREEMLSSNKLIKYPFFS